MAVYLERVQGFGWVDAVPSKYDKVKCDGGTAGSVAELVYGVHLRGGGYNAAGSTAPVASQCAAGAQQKHRTLRNTSSQDLRAHAQVAY